MYLVPGHKVAIEIYWKGRLDGMATASNKTYLEKQSKAWRCSLIVFLSVCVCVRAQIPRIKEKAPVPPAGKKGRAEQSSSRAKGIADSTCSRGFYSNHKDLI